jgi:hypothetical protein
MTHLGVHPNLTKSLIQWVRKVYATVTENYANSNYFISGQRRARKALFFAFDADCAGLFHDKILTLQNL